MPIPVTCSSCGHAGRVPDMARGRVIKCPKCGTQFRVGEPEPEVIEDVEVVPAVEEADPGYEEVAEDAPRSRKRCPECGTPMQPGAVLCTQCGYDTRTGKKRRRSPSRPARRPVEEPARSGGFFSGIEWDGIGGLVVFLLIFGVGNAILYATTGWVIIPIRR